MIYVKGEFDCELFNEVFMMYILILLQYGIVVLMEIVVVMMCGNTGCKFMQDLIDCVICFCKEIKCLKGESEGWFFDVW